MIFKFDKKLFKYQYIVFMSKLFSYPKYIYAWYESAIKVRKEDIMQSQFLKVS